MNERERFLATMRYQPRDRSPIIDFGFWDETPTIWHGQGLPSHVNRLNSDQFFGMDVGLEHLVSPVGIEVGLLPTFEEEVIEDRGDHEVLRQSNGVVVLRREFMSSIPQHLRHTLVDRDSWRKEYLPRLDPLHPNRFPTGWDERVRSWCDPHREQVIALPGGSLYGWLRDWMGLEQLSLVVYDDPAWFEEMVTSIADCIVGTLARVLETGGHFDACAMWEDMCYSAGPLISPRHFKRFLSPHYRRIADLLHKYDIDVIWVDCDGKIDLLLPLWLDAGINCMFPLEVGTWRADPLRFRQEYGRDLLMMGGFDKRILAHSLASITNEIVRLAPLVEEGGYIGFCDHRVPPDVPYENYLHYLMTARAIWGNGCNLKPMSPSLRGKEK